MLDEREGIARNSSAGQALLKITPNEYYGHPPIYTLRKIKVTVPVLCNKMRKLVESSNLELLILSTEKSQNYVLLGGSILSLISFLVI